MGFSLTTIQPIAKAAGGQMGEAEGLKSVRVIVRVQQSKAAETCGNQKADCLSLLGLSRFVWYSIGGRFSLLT
jgi:hypothetical protein